MWTAGTAGTAGGEGSLVDSHGDVIEPGEKLGGVLPTGDGVSEKTHDGEYVREYSEPGDAGSCTDGDFVKGLGVVGGVFDVDEGGFDGGGFNVDGVGFDGGDFGIDGGFFDVEESFDIKC